MHRAVFRKRFRGILLAGLIGLIAGCGGNNGGGPSANPDTTAPTVSGVNVASGSAMDLHAKVVITFSEPMDTGSLVLGGTMAGESDKGVWASATKASLGAVPKAETDQNRLTVSPTSGWTSGNDRTLSIDVKDLAGNALHTLNLVYNVVMGIVYVSPSGDNANDGTISAPRKTIPAGISQADTLKYHPGAVFVAAGAYPVDSGAASGTQVVLMEGISLYGGYTADFSQRDPAANPTTLQDESADAALGTLPNRAIDAGKGVTTATRVDGFQIQGGHGYFSSGVFAHDGGSPTLVHNIIDGGAGSIESRGIYDNSSSPSIQSDTIDGGGGGAGSYGIKNDSSSPAIQSNTIDGGGGSAGSFGISNNNSSSPSIENNTIDGGGGGSTSYGIDNESSSPSIRNNTINGGAGSAYSFGVYINNNSSPSIRNNTIDGGAGSPKSFGIIINFSSPSIQNNIVITSEASEGVCIQKVNGTSNPVSVQNNDLFDCPTALFLDEVNPPLQVIKAVNELTDIMSGGNVSIDPAFVNLDGPDGDIKTMADNDWHLSGSSPAEVTQGGLDLSSDFTTDKDGVTRTVPWSMGAYEHD